MVCGLKEEQRQERLSQDNTSWPIISGYENPLSGFSFSLADLQPSLFVSSAAECASTCLSYSGPSFRSLGCISFNLCGSSAPFTCNLQGYNRTLTLINASTCALYQRQIPRNETPIVQAVPWALSRPPPRSVRLLGGSLRDMFNANAGFLLSFSVDDLLFPFRARAGLPQPAGSNCILWDCKVDWVEGSVAAQFLMGAGNHLQWEEHPQLRSAMNAVIAGIESCAQENGFILGFTENKLATNEHPNYVLSWTIHGLLAASGAGNELALPMARKMMSLFNNHTLLPTFLPPDGGNSPYQNPAGPPPPNWNGFNRTGDGALTGHNIYLINQGIIHNTQMALSPLGEQQDVDLVLNLYQETWWLQFLISGDPASIWLRQWFSHNYEVTAFEAYLDMYVLTGSTIYLDAVLSAWGMWRTYFLFTGGSAAINENWYFPPGSYYLLANSSNHQDNWSNHPTGELCGGVFWLRLNQRLHHLYPNNETFVLEMETQLVNEAPTHQDGSIGIRHFSVLNGVKENASAFGNCCEGQGARLYASTPEYIFTLTAPPAPEGIYVDLYSSSSLLFEMRNGDLVNLTLDTDFPNNGNVNITLLSVKEVVFDLFIRIPSWIDSKTRVSVNINGKAEETEGVPGSYFHIQQQTWNVHPTIISFSFPFTLTGHNYTGLTQVPSFSRAAVMYGPILLAAVGRWNSTFGSIVMPNGLDPLRPSDWLIPMENNSLIFNVKVNGSVMNEITFLPQSRVSDETLFSVFPLFRK